MQSSYSSASLLMRGISIISNMDDIKFRDFSNFLISGSTQSGKTQFTKKLLMNTNHMFVTPPEVSYTFIYFFLNVCKSLERMQ